MTIITIKRGPNLKTILKPLGKGDSTWKDFAGNWHLSKAVKAPRYYEVLLNDLLSAAGNDTELRNMILQVIQRMSLGWTDQNQPTAQHSTVGQATSLLNNAGANSDFNNVPNSDRKPHPNGPDTSSLVPPRVPTNRNVSTMRDSITNPNAATNANTQSPQVSGYRRSYRGSLFQKSPTNFLYKSYNPNFIVKSDGKNTQIVGYISNTLEDSDGERMHPNLITRWAEDLKTGDIHLDLNHDTEHVNSVIGYFTDSEIHRDGSDLWLLGKAKVDDSRDDVKQIINLIKLGSKLGLSIEGSPKSFKMEKQVKVWTDVKLLGAGIVTNPSCNQCRTLGVNN